MLFLLLEYSKLLSHTLFINTKATILPRLKLELTYHKHKTIDRISITGKSRDKEKQCGKGGRCY